MVITLYLWVEGQAIQSIWHDTKVIGMLKKPINDWKGKKRMKTFLLTVAMTTGLTGAGFAAAGEDKAKMPEREILMAKPVTLPGNRVVAKVIRVHFPVGFKTPEHIHKGPGPRYVLQGKMKIVDKNSTEVYGPGEVFWETGEPMVAENAGEGEAVLLIFEMAPPTKKTKPKKIVIKPR